MFAPVALLVDFVHVRSIDITKVKSEEMAVLRLMEKNHPDLYAAFLKKVREKERCTKR